MMDNVASKTVARTLLELAGQLGVRHIFTNLGSDHPAFIEAFAAIDEDGATMPHVVVCPHEMTALSAAHGFAMVTRQPQMVLVHVDVGTQNLGCSIHNAAKGRVPVFIMAGLSPLVPAGDQPGIRTEYIHYIQDTSRQHEIGGQYMKWSYELRAAEMVAPVLLRGMQIATSAPEGPVYLTGAREIWEHPVPTPNETPELWPAASQAGLPDDALRELYDAMAAAQRPLVITSYAGRHESSVAKLVALSERVGLGVCEVSPQYVNFPGDHPHHLGYRRNALVDEADFILILDVDVPWLPSKVQPRPDAKLFHLDTDPIKRDIGFWHFPAHRSYQVDSSVVLGQLLALAENDKVSSDARNGWLADARQRMTASPAPTPAQDTLDVKRACESVRKLVNDDTVVLFEAPTATETLLSTLRMNRAGSYYANGGSGLGWSINAAIGVKMANPKAEVITVVGDGSYIFGVPSSAYWVADTYQTPHLTVILNNKGWNAPKRSTLLVHPQGTANRRDRFWTTIGSKARLADIAGAAGDVAAFQVSNAAELDATLQEAMNVVRAGRSAVVDVIVTPISQQVLG